LECAVTGGVCKLQEYKGCEKGFAEVRIAKELGTRVRARPACSALLMRYYNQ